MKEGLTACMNCGICTASVPPPSSTTTTRARSSIPSKPRTTMQSSNCSRAKQSGIAANACLAVRVARGPIRRAISSRRSAGSRKNWDFSLTRKKDGSSWPSNARSGTTSSKPVTASSRTCRPGTPPRTRPRLEVDLRTRPRRIRTLRLTTTAKWASAQCAKSTTRAGGDRAIFDTTGGTDFFENIEKYSAEKATEMGYDGADERYFRDVFTANSGSHQ